MEHMIKSEFLGIPELTQNPCTCTIICFLGLGIDTVSKTIFISEDKVTVLLKKNNDALSCKKINVNK